MFPFTPSVVDMHGIEACCDELLEEGLDNSIARHDLAARACRAGVKAMGLELWPRSEEITAACVTAIAVPEGLTDIQVRAHCRERYGVMISSGQGAGNLVRIGHMGPTASSLLPRRRARRARAHDRRPRCAGEARRRPRGGARGALGDGGGRRGVTLPPFDLHRPQSLEEATELADRYGEDAAFYCGGTELLLLLKLGFASFGHLIDLKGVEELAGVRAENGRLVVGAAVTHRELERSELVRERLPAPGRHGAAGGEPPRARGRHARRQSLLLGSALRPGHVPARSGRRGRVPARRRGCPSDSDLGLRRRPVPDEPGRGRGAHLRADTRASAGCRRRPREVRVPRAPDGDGRLSRSGRGREVAEARVAVGSVGARPVRAPSGGAGAHGAPADEIGSGLLGGSGRASRRGGGSRGRRDRLRRVQGAARARARRADLPARRSHDRPSRRAGGDRPAGRTPSRRRCASSTSTRSSATRSTSALATSATPWLRPAWRWSGV